MHGDTECRIYGGCMHGDMHEFIVNTWYVLLCVSYFGHCDGMPCMTLTSLLRLSRVLRRLSFYIVDVVSINFEIFCYCVSSIWKVNWTCCNTLTSFVAD